MIEAMFNKIRNASPFTLFWVMFYTVAIVGLFVPWDVGQWFAVALATPMFLATAVVVILLAVGIVSVICRYCLRGLKHQ